LYIELLTFLTTITCREASGHGSAVDLSALAGKARRGTGAARKALAAPSKAASKASPDKKKAVPKKKVHRDRQPMLFFL